MSKSNSRKTGANSRSAKHYRKSAKSRKKKAEYDKKYNKTKRAKKKRAEANKARRKAKASGKNVKGKDASHTKNGIRFKKASKNRGSKKDSSGDKRARGGKKK